MTMFGRHSTKKETDMSSRQATVVAVAILVLAVAGVAFWQLWWIPKTAFSCNGMPTGAPTPAAAAAEFTERLVARDRSGMCAVMVDKLNDSELDALAKRINKQLGNPSSADQVTIHIGEQGGSTFPLRLEGPGGSVELWVQSFLDWYRVGV